MTLDKIKALIAESDKTGRPIQVKVSDRWVTTRANEDVTFQLSEDSYRVEPPKLREWWIHGSSWPVEAGISRTADTGYEQAGWIRVREVVEDSE